MWAVLVSALVPLLPSLIADIEQLFSRKPKSGPQKLNAVQQLALNAVVLAGIVDPKDFGDAEMKLVQSITDAIVAYNNAKGIFGHSA